MKIEEFTHPFRHWIVGGFADADMVRRAREAAARTACWITYDNGLERKRTSEKRGDLSDGCNAVLDWLAGPAAVDLFSFLTGIPLQADPSRRCAGLHAMSAGGHLLTHIDAALHPSGLERRANAILYLDDVDPRHGGGLQLCDPDGTVAKTLYPKAGDIVLWPCGDETYHGVEPLAFDSPVRFTMAAFYLGERRPGATRKRALFLPPR